MTSLISAVAFLTLSGLFGFALSKKIKDKRDFYKSLLSFNHDLIMEIDFQRRDILSLLSKRYISDDFNDILNQKKAVIKGYYSDMFFPNYLSDSERLDLKEYFSKMGMQDPQTSIEFLKRFGEIFSRLYNDFLQEEKVKGALYRKMGVIIGIIAFIIVV